MDEKELRDEATGGPLVVVPDANVLIHGRALVDLPWAELGRSEIVVLFVPPMVRELDKLKTQTGRQNKLARQLSSDIRALVTAPDRRAAVRMAHPVVSKRIELRAVTESLHPALRLDHADQALINYALWIQRQGSDVLLLTDDTICGTTAEEVGLPVRFLPDTWLRQPEADEGAKENTRLKAEVQRLSANEPKVELGFRNSAGVPLTEIVTRLTSWPALNGTELDGLMEQVQRHCPQATSFHRLEPGATDALLGRYERMSRLSAFSPRSEYKPATEKEIERYKTVDYPTWLETVRSSLACLHRTLTARTEWPNVVAVAANVGARPATEALLTIKARGGIDLLNDDRANKDAGDGDESGAKAARLALPMPPQPPRGRTVTFDMLGFSRDLSSSGFAMASVVPSVLPDFLPKRPRDSDAFYWRIGQREWGGTMELECASWRHGQNPIDFLLRVRPSEQVATSAVIELGVQAHNIADPRMVRLPVRFECEDGSTLDEGRALVDILCRATKARERMQ